MKFEDLFDQLADAFKAPETLEDAIEYIKKDPTCQVTIEDLAFKQVVINILVAAGIVEPVDSPKADLENKDEQAADPYKKCKAGKNRLR